MWWNAGEHMAGMTRQTVVGLAVLAALGVGLIALGVLSLDTGVGTRVYVDSLSGQQWMLVLFLIPTGAALLALALVIPLAELHRSRTGRASIADGHARLRPPPAGGGTDPAAIAVEFNDAVSRGDVDGLARLMTDDHVFVDTVGAVVWGKPRCLDAWRGFFVSFPDYRNVLDSLVTRGAVVTIVGRSECSEPSLCGPAIWTAIVQDGRVAEWRVHDDTPQVRQRLSLPPH